MSDTQNETLCFSNASSPGRSSVLAKYDILDTPREQQFDDVVKLAAAICAAPIAVVNLVGDDRQWFKAEVGLGVRETPLDTSFCAHAILEEDFLEIRDATKDSRFAANPLVDAAGGIRFYAGALLKNQAGLAIGTLCILDTRTRPDGLSELQRFTLQMLATQVMSQLELRKVARQEREIKNELANAALRFQSIFDSAIDYAIIVMDRTGSITDWNAGAANILGWSAEEILGRDLSIFFTPEDRADAVPSHEMRQALANGRGADERWHMRKSGERFWASGEMMPLKDADDVIVGFVKVLRDKTQARMLQDRIALQEERLQMALTASGSVGLWDWMVSSDRIHGDANFARLYGLDVDGCTAGLTEEQYQRYVVAEDLPALRASIRAVFERGADFLVDYRLAIPGEQIRWVECKGRMVVDAAGHPYRFSGTSVDVTARKAAEQQKQLLMQEMSHRVKNSFTMVQSLASQTLRGIDSEVRETLLSRIVALGQANDSLLQTSWTATQMSALLQRILWLGADSGRIALCGTDMQVSAEAAMSLSLIVHELATNAVKYGALSLETGQVVVSWHHDGSHFQLLWQERGGPIVEKPATKGFGSRLISMGICGSRDVLIEYLPEGLQARFSVNLGRVFPKV
ncbi:PAS domain S-box protein [Novosphingobium guangzhouense]|uniref:PAS domain S-box protein n=1 Tax=Novosphingobium guangzhouense TaxID=1850347 RepID=UPI00147584A1|nr:PAS domain S-box protein [Novosphingobium guangzhouense]